MGFNGLNITYPCKQAVIPLLHELSDDARALGAVNTVVFKDGRRTGHNTDGGASPRASAAACRSASGTGWCRWAPAALARRWPMRPSSWASAS